MDFAEFFILVLFFVAEISCRCPVHSKTKTNYKEATISDGRIRGKRYTTSKGTLYYGFQDIPYAKPPVGQLRLKKSVPPEKWSGVLNTTENLKICHQFSESWSDPKENEDCLVLNVYAPDDPHCQQQNLSVIAWIHGGSFLVWSGIKDQFGPDYYIDQCIVVVTINYRLGPLGFLTTDDKLIEANLGLKDQHLALTWINKNIKHFGGDPSKVTIAGQSAGAASVGYHVLNKKSKGLFRAAIMESGSPLICWSVQRKGITVAQQLTSLLTGGLSNETSSSEILSIMKSADIKDLKEATYELQAQNGSTNCQQYTSLLLTPVLEDENDENAFVTGLNHEKIKNGDFYQVPIIIGINSEEALLFGVAGLVFQASLFDPDIKKLVPANTNMKDENRGPAGEDLKQLYTNLSFALSPAAAINVLSDCLFTTPIIRHAVLQSKYTPVYFYQFSYRAVLGRYVYDDIAGAAGVAHQEELGFFWHNVTNGDLSQYPKEDIIVHEKASQLWANFVKYLNPTPEKQSASRNSEIKWPKFTQENLSYLDINSNSTIKKNPKKYLESMEIYNKYAEEKLLTI